MGYKCNFLILLITIFSFSQVAAAEISRNNYVDWVAASSVGTSTSHFVQWKNAIDSACMVSDSVGRTRISIDDDALFALLLTARTTNKKVGFYYETTTVSGAVPGHGVSCQIVNAWLESD